MAKINYSYQKRQKELATKKKQQEKQREKLARKKLADNVDPIQDPNKDIAAV